MQMTITEALAEIKTVGKRLEKKRDFIGNYLLRQEMYKDPLEKDGGSVTAIKRELQAIGDLEQRLIDLRAVIADTNTTTPLTVMGETRAVADWLVWRREVLPLRTNFLRRLSNTIHSAREEAMRKGVGVVAAGEPTKQTDLIINISEAELAKEIEQLEELEGTLDGKLSLVNATTFVEVEA